MNCKLKLANARSLSDIVVLILCKFVSATRVLYFYVLSMFSSFSEVLELSLYFSYDYYSTRRSTITFCYFFKFLYLQLFCISVQFLR